MLSMDQARETCEDLLPGLVDTLGAVPLAELEARGNKGLEIFRAACGPSLLIPAECGGLNADPLQAMRVMRVIGSLSPSLAVATTMHHFSVATVFTLAESIQRSGLEWALLEAVARNNLLVASGFAEGRSNAGILSPTMTAVADENGGYLVNGSKKPCSLAYSMNLLTAAIMVESPGAEPCPGFLLVPGELPGITRHPFWASPVLGGAESDEIRLTDVRVEKELVMLTEPRRAGALDELNTLGLLWFELLVSSSYLGVASALVERALTAARGPASERVAMAARLESAALLLEIGARRIRDGAKDNGALADVLIARYGVQDAITSAATKAVELLGGMAFIGDGDVAYLIAATQCLAFHPPSRTASQPSLLQYLQGTGPVLVD